MMHVLNSLKNQAAKIAINVTKYAMYEKYYFGALG